MFISIARFAPDPARIDPVPAGLTDDVKFALTVHALHAEVAELQRLGLESPLGRLSS